MVRDCTAQVPEGYASLRVGTERISGDYGGAVDYRDLCVPVTLLLERGRFGFRATVPYLDVEFTDPVDGSTYTESGMGDVVLGFTLSCRGVCGGIGACKATSQGGLTDTTLDLGVALSRRRDF